MFELKLPYEIITCEFDGAQDVYARGGGIYTKLLLENNMAFKSKQSRIYVGLNSYNFNCLRTYLHQVKYYNHSLKKDSVSTNYGEIDKYILMHFNSIECVILNTDDLTFHETKELMCRLGSNTERLIV